jgi:hypothetical protein
MTSFFVDAFIVINEQPCFAVVKRERLTRTAVLSSRA